MMMLNPYPSPLIPPNLFVAYAGTDRTKVQAGDVVICYQRRLDYVDPVLPSGFTSLGTASTGSATSDLAVRASFWVATGALGTTPSDLYTLRVLRSSIPLTAAVQASPANVSARKAPIGLVYWGLSANSGRADPVPTHGTISPSSPLDTNSFAVNLVRSATGGDNTFYSNSSLACSIYTGPAGGLPRTTYTLTAGSGVSVLGWLRINGA